MGGAEELGGGAEDLGGGAEGWGGRGEPERVSELPVLSDADYTPPPSLLLRC